MADRLMLEKIRSIKEQWIKINKPPSRTIYLREAFFCYHQRSTGTEHNTLLSHIFVFSSLKYQN